MRSFNRLIYEKRIEKKLSIKEVAEALNISKNLLSNYEKGYYKVSQKSFDKLCAFYDIDPAELEEGCLIYADELPEEEEAEEEVLENSDKKRKKRKPNSSRNFFVLSFFLIVLLTLSIASVMLYTDSRTNITKYYSSEYMQVVDYIYAHKQEIPEEEEPENPEVPGRGGENLKRQELRRENLKYQMALKMT